MSKINSLKSAVDETDSADILRRMSRKPYPTLRSLSVVGWDMVGNPPW
jgi:hypothetical protein